MSLYTLTQVTAPAVKFSVGPGEVPLTTTLCRLSQAIGRVTEVTRRI